MVTKVLVKHNEYRDSVFLMVINQAVRATKGVDEIALMMGTNNNKEVMRDVGFARPEIDSATVNDMVICIRAENEKIIENVREQIEEMLSKKPSGEEARDIYKTLDAVIREIPDTNLAIISVPGQFAAREGRKALKKGLNILLFSDNVPLDEEIELKKLAGQLDRIVMGPDCGTAIINHVPLAFANAIRPGSIGIVAAAGTGLQEIASLIDREGLGISQAIGTGGRDLSDKVGGTSMLKGIEILEKDPETQLIVLVSKPPDSITMHKVMERVSKSSKKVIVNFLGGDPEVVKGSGAVPAYTLEEAALMAVGILTGKAYQHRNFSLPEDQLKALFRRETKNIHTKQKFIRGLYSGGTLCEEAMLILADSLGDVYSNIPLKTKLMLKDPSKGYKHSCIDLGDDYFTRGKPHSMISPETRQQCIVREAKDPEVAVILLDVVLGYGAHMDMAGALGGSIKEAKLLVGNSGGYLSVVASVCGTSEDPQGLDSQIAKLEDAGVVVMPSNSQAARFATMIAVRNNLIDRS